MHIFHILKCSPELQPVPNYLVSLKKLLQKGISNPEFYGDLVCKFKKIIESPTSLIFSIILLTVSKSQVFRFARASSHVSDFNSRHIFLTVKLLKQSYVYHKLRKAFSKIYRRLFELIEKYNVSLKKLLKQGISNPGFYGDLVYKYTKIIGNPNFSDLFKRIANRFKNRL